MIDGDPKILPKNASALERAIDAAGEARLQLLKIQIRHLWNALTCPAPWLPILAWALGVDTWRSDWPEDTKRAVIAATPTVKRLKGTVGAVRRAVQAVAGTAQVSIIEWFRAGGSGVPMTATVDIDVTQGAPARLPHDAIHAANAAKRESVHIDIRLTARPRAAVHAAALIRRPITFARLNLANDLRPNLGAGLAPATLIRRPLVFATLRGNFS